MKPILEKSRTGVIVVDHGSRREESNLLLLQFVDLFRERSGYRVVEPAHMELAEPSIEVAFRNCIEQGAQSIIVSPFFLLPGRHWQDDIPRLAAEASSRFNDVPYLVTSPLGIHEKLVEVMVDRIDFCLNPDSEQPCSNCSGEMRCRTTGTNRNQGA